MRALSRPAHLPEQPTPEAQALRGPLAPRDAEPMTSRSSEPLASTLDDQLLLSSLSEQLGGRPPPVRLGRFVLTRRIGRGGMGAVYAAHDAKTGEPFAIKVLDDDGAGHRLREEFRTAVDLRHRGIVRLYELGCAAGRPYLVMERIEGVDIVRSIHRDARPGEPHSSPRVRMRALLGQLAEALHFLHRSNRVHGDVKASNVLVTAEDRVVLLDFGLGSDLVDRHSEPTWSRSASPGGTPGYRAPEATLSPARDWYSFGVLLYLAVHGELPTVTGTGAWRASPGDADLRDLFHRLTASDPSDRAGGTEVLTVLGRDGSQVVEQPGATLVGRTDELARMHRAARARAECPTVLTVSGVSGVGKTTLARAFLRELQNDFGYAVLSARCHEREAVRYMGLDALMVATVQHLGRLPTQVVPYLLPRHIRALAQLFPRLLEVTAVADAPPSATVRDPQEALRCAAMALKELLCRLADRSPLAIWIDDLQWIDADSVNVLGELLRGTEIPRALFVFSHRSEDPSGARRLDALLHTAAPDLARTSVELAPLRRKDAVALACSVLSSDSLQTYAEGIAHETQGHPLFVIELARFIVRHAHEIAANDVGSQPSLDALVAERIASLGASATAMLEVIAIAKGPIREALVSHVAGAAAKAALVELRRAMLVRSAGSDGETAVEIFHDRIREGVQRRIEPARRAAMHRALAEAHLADHAPQPELIAWHYREAGATVDALPWLIRAADAAAENLAFTRAIAMYRDALAWQGAGELRRSVLRRLGEAERCAGRSEDAGATFLAAAEGVSPEEALELRRSAVHELLRCGQVFRARPVMDLVLAQVGLRAPQTFFGLLCWTLFHLVYLGIRGFGYRERSEAEVGATRLSQIDTCWSIGHGVSQVDMLQAAYFANLTTLLALRAGEPKRVAHALVRVANVRSMMNPNDVRVGAMLAEAEGIAQRCGDAYASAMVRVVQAHAALNRGDWPTALSAAEAAETEFRERCSGVPHDLLAAHTAITNSLEQMGRLNEYRQRVASLRREAEERGNRVLALTMLADEHRSLMFDDRPDEAFAVLDATLERWPSQGFVLPHAIVYLGRAWLHAYCGAGERAAAAASLAWKLVRRQMGHKLTLLRLQCVATLGRSALAAFVDTQAPQHLRTTRRAIRMLGREQNALAAVHAEQLRGLVALENGDAEAAAEALTAAADGFESLHMPLWAAATRVRVPAWGPVRAGRPDYESSTLAAAGVRNPTRLVHLYAPGRPVTDGSASEK